MKYAVCIEMLYHEVPFYDRIALAKADGFDYITMWDWKDKNLKRLREECEKHGVTIADFVGDNNPYSMILAEDHEGFYEEFLKAVEVAKEIRSDYIMIHSDSCMNWVAKPVPESISEEQKRQSIIDMLKRVADVAQKEGIPILYEPLNNKVDHIGYFEDGSHEAAKVIREINCDKLKIIYDIYHMQIMQGNIIENLKADIDSIGYVHFGDVPGRNEPGTGEINLPNVINALVDMGYDGMLEFELKPKADTKSAIKAIKAAINATKATPI